MVTNAVKPASDYRKRIVFNGYVFAQTGYGTASRAYIRALRWSSSDMSVVDRNPHKRIDVADPVVLALLNKPLRPDIYICHSEIQDVVSLEALFQSLIVLTTWETDVLPDGHIQILNRVKEVWVPSRFNRTVFENCLAVPVFRLPHPVRWLRCAANRADLCRVIGVPDKSFLVVNIATWQARKNPMGCIEAFLRAFSTTGDAFLVLKNRFDFVERNEALNDIRRLCDSLDIPYPFAAARIRLIDTSWPEDMISTLIRRANCYLSLHRGEGWCYPLFDAVCSGVPVIATGYSGPMDYLSKRHNMLVHYALCRVHQPGQRTPFYFSQRMAWADPDVEHAVFLLRSLYADYSHYKKISTRWSAVVAGRYSERRVGRLAERRLETI